jgi:acetylornithine/N-succinyldiaminopimelate aminotransferase
MADNLMPTYSRLPVQFTHGEGAWLWDTEGRQYLDAVSGVAVCALGHAWPPLTRALCEQAGRLIHTSNLYGIGLQAELAAALARISGMSRTFFCNSGAEANEAALKIARLHGHGRKIATPTVVVTKGSFHGRTLATLTATGNRRVQAGFEPLVQGFIRVPYNDLDAIRTVAENSDDVVAVLVEPVQGEGGIRIPDGGYLEGIRRLCDEHGWLMILDEIQTGMGRTGKWFAFQHGGAAPDIVTLAKSLGNGVPIGACLARGAAAEAFRPGSHGSTFGGNPLASRAALTVIDSIEKEGLVERAARLGKMLLEELATALADAACVVDVRGLGLMIGIELDRPCQALVGNALQRGLLINVTADKVIRLLPPLVLGDAQATRIVEDVSALIHEFQEHS